jgi:hypothetical protein
MTVEQLVVIAIAVLIALGNLLARRRQSRPAAGPPHEPGVPDGLAPVGKPPRPRRRPAPSAPPPSDLPVTRRRRRSRLGTLREVRRGIVLMTILGPCRGAEPPASAARGGRPAGASPP